jgi:BirA family biotin operon repressor/biotin-[acetyl-CoA-carboxylase] ligase
MQFFNYEELDSTQTLAKAMLDGKNQDLPFCITAQSQRAGTGRSGKAWSSDEGNFYCSLVLDRLFFYEPKLTPYYSALAVFNLIHKICGKACNLSQLKVKFPNDIMLNGKKLCGILTQSSKDAIIIGIGINIANHPNLEGQPYRATSLTSELAFNNPLQNNQIASELWQIMLGLQNTQPSTLLRGINDILFKKNEEVTITNTRYNKAISGTNKGIDADGSLQVTDGDGNVVSLNFGDVNVDF